MLTILFSDHTLPSKGMYSMNRTLMGRSRVRATKSEISSSLTPFITTTFTFTRNARERERIRME